MDAVKGERFEGVYVLAATCGLRIGEILALRYEDIDLERGTVRIEHTLYHGECTAPKTQSSRRTLTLPRTALESLVRLCNGSTNPLRGICSLQPTVSLWTCLTSISGHGVQHYGKRDCRRA